MYAWGYNEKDPATNLVFTSKGGISDWGGILLGLQDRGILPPAETNETAEQVDANTEKAKAIVLNNQDTNLESIQESAELDLITTEGYDILRANDFTDEKLQSMSVKEINDKLIELAPKSAEPELTEEQLAGIPDDLPFQDDEQFDMANENARLDDIYPEYTGETIRIIDPAELKQAQYEVIQHTNPMQDEYHVGIRSVNDIKTFDETIDDEESFVWGDYSQEDAKRDLAKNEITIYSSKPIENGVFVSTSYRQAQEYAGGKSAKVYEKTVPLDYVAWISGDEGQFAITDVIGKERTVYNSNGDRIAKSEPALRNFYKWFGNSKVVDEQGRPLVVYHGTDAEFDTFDISMVGKTDYGYYGRGFYFARNIDMASNYGQNIKKVYLKINNPLNLDKIIGRTLGNVLNDSAFETGAFLLKKLGVLYPYEEKRVNEYEKIKKHFLENIKVYNDGYYYAEYTSPDGNYYKARASFYDNTEENAKNTLFKKYLSNIEIDGISADKILLNFSIEDYMRNNVGSTAKFTDMVIKNGFDGIFSGDEIVVFDTYEHKFRQSKNALQEIVNGAEESTVKDLRDDLSQYGGTNDVAFVFGDKKKGIAHIVDSHGVDVLPQVFDTVIDGKIQRYVAGNKTVILEKNGYEAVLSLDEHGKTKTWLLSGWKISTDETSEVSATSSPTQDRPTFSRSELGAVLDTMSITQAYKNVNPQIKSVDNRGTYSSDTGNIYLQNNQVGKGGAYDPTTRSITLGGKADATTLPHELAHYWIDKNFKWARSGKASQEWKRQWQAVEKWLGIDPEDKVLSKQASEKFARAYEKFLGEEKAPLVLEKKKHYDNIVVI